MQYIEISLLAREREARKRKENEEIVRIERNQGVVGCQQRIELGRFGKLDVLGDKLGESVAFAQRHFDEADRQE